MYWAFCPGPVLVAAILSSQQGLFHAPPGLAEAAINHRLRCISYQVVPGQSQAVTDLGLYRSSAQETTEPTYIEVGFRLQQSIT